MGHHNARMWLARSQGDRLEVLVDLDDERLSITSNGASIGDWALSDLEIVQALRNLHVFVEGEHLVIAPTDPDFAADVRAFGAPPEERESGPTREVGALNGGSGVGSEEARAKPRRGAHRAPARMRWKWGRMDRHAGSHG